MQVTLNSNGYRAAINSLGAELKSFTDPSGREFIWNSNPEHWMRSSPLLFPTIGNVRNNETMIRGKRCEMPKHGFCKDSEFEVTSQEKDCVTFHLGTSEDTLTHYPFHFDLYLTYTLENEVLSMTYQVFNQDTETMPYHIGAHPGFMCPLNENENFSDYVLEFEKDECLDSCPYDLQALCFCPDRKVHQGGQGRILPLSIPMFDNDAVFFPHTNSRSVSLINPSTRKGVRMDYTDFKSIAFWTPAGGNAPFLCLEPWNGAAIYADEDDEFIHKRDIITLNAGETHTYHLKLALLGY